jgi:hypothetical protein
MGRLESHGAPLVSDPLALSLTILSGYVGLWLVGWWVMNKWR